MTSVGFMLFKPEIRPSAHQNCHNNQWMICQNLMVGEDGLHECEENLWGCVVLGRVHCLEHFSHWHKYWQMTHLHFVLMYKMRLQNLLVPLFEPRGSALTAKRFCYSIKFLPSCERRSPVNRNFPPVFLLFLENQTDQQFEHFWLDDKIRWQTLHLKKKNNLNDRIHLWEKKVKNFMSYAATYH